MNSSLLPSDSFAMILTEIVSSINSGQSAELSCTF